MRRRLLLLALSPLLAGADKPRLVPDVSQRRIDIVYSFHGAELLLFGAIVHPGGRPPDRRTDVAVVVKGPGQSLVVREKAKVMGLWLNHDSQRFGSAPAFYAVASSRPLPELVSARTAAIYELGVGNLQLSPGGAATPEARTRFERGLIDLKRRVGLYVEQPRGVSVDEGVLYRARIAIPARVAVGRYTAETFLIRDGRVVAGASRDIVIDKSGFERFVALWAERRPGSYGLFAVALSLAFGWAGAALFGRRA